MLFISVNDKWIVVTRKGQDCEHWSVRVVLVEGDNEILLTQWPNLASWFPDEVVPRFRDRKLKTRRLTIVEMGKGYVSTVHLHPWMSERNLRTGT